MIIEKEKTVKLRKNTREYFINKGYKEASYQNEIVIKTEDLTPGSHEKVRVRCDFCEIEKEIPFRDYHHSVINHITGKYACQKHTREKELEATMIKHEQGILEKNDRFYYYIREHRLELLKEFIEKNKSIDGMWNDNIYNYFYNYNDDILQAVKDLGYDPDSLRTNSPKNKWEKIEDVEEALQSFISLYGYFPTRKEMIYEVGISGSALKKYDGALGLRKIIKYKGNNELIDNRGDYNRSTFEFITANFLIAQEIGYKREQSPFPKEEKKYRSDFTLFPKNKKPIHVEVWGYPEKDDKSEHAKFYNEKRKEKEKIYKKYNVNLVSVNFEIFQKSYKEIEEELYHIFNPVLNLKYDKIDFSLLVPPNKLSDEELLEKVMKYSDSNKMLPKSEDISKKENGVYKELLKRYKNMRNVAEKFNLNLPGSSKNFWSKEIIEKKMIEMMKKHNKIISKKEIKDEQYTEFTGIWFQVGKYGGTMYHRMKAYQYCLKNNIELPESELKYIRSKCRSLNIPKTTPIDEIIELSLKQKATS